MFLNFFGNGETSYLYNNAVAWIVAVIFAYITNKLFVFNLRSWKIKVVSKEILKFLGARIFSFAIEEAGLWLFIDILNFNKFAFNLFSFNFTGELIAKVIFAIVVIVLNYFFSKFIIFKEKISRILEKISLLGGFFLFCRLWFKKGNICNRCNNLNDKNLEVLL